MSSLRLLGSLSLTGADGGEIRSVSAQPKRIALLSYLAIASRTGPVRRDTVLGLFWPELDTARARHALRQAIYQLRRELGPDVLDGNGDDQLRVNRSALSCDACAFVDAVGAGDRERALALYQGDLLAGLYVGGCPEFEQWLESTRALLRSEALEAAGELSATAERADRRAEAVRWARRALELAPFDEQVLRRLLTVLEAAGDPGTAVLAYEAFAERCQRELGVAPTAETLALVTRLRSKPVARRRRRRVSGPPASLAGEPPSTPVPGRNGRWLAVAVAAMVVAAVPLGARWAFGPSAMDRNVMAVPPFRLLAPTPDSLVLTEGIAELLTIALQSETEPRVLDPGVVSGRWRALTRRRTNGQEQAREVARSLGAGLVLHGSAFYRGTDVVISATLVDVKTGDLRTSATEAGPADRLVALVQRLAARTLGALTGEDPLRLEQLTSTNFEAVRSYLSGRAASRRGEYEQAVALLKRALEIDSTFAAAALALIDVSGWSGRDEQGDYERLAYRYRDRLGPRDTAYLRAWIGYDAYTDRGSSGDLMRATENAAAAVRDRPELLYLLGDRYFHTGEFLERANSLARSRELMERAIALDSGFSPGREHLVELAVLTDDSEAVRRYRADLMEREPTGLRTPFLRWLAARYLREESEASRLRAAFDTIDRIALNLVVRTAQEAGIGLDDAERAASTLLARAGTESELAGARNNAEMLFRNLGRPGEAERVNPFMPVTGSTPIPALMRILRVALLSDAMPASAGQAAHELERRIQLPATTPADVLGQHHALFATLWWKLWNGDTTGAVNGLAQLRDAPLFKPEQIPAAPASHRALRLAIIEALYERTIAPGRPAASRPALLRLDSLARLGVSATEATFANVMLMRMFEEAGDRQRALAAAGRRMRNLGPSFWWLAPMLRQEARLAAAVGEREHAAAAYRHYLALRSKPEPALRAVVDSARAEYRRLLKN